MMMVSNETVVARPATTVDQSTEIRRSEPVSGWKEWLILILLYGLIYLVYQAGIQYLEAVWESVTNWFQQVQYR